MSCGIYEIVNTKTGYRYIGQSRRIEERWQNEHIPLLNRGQHLHPKLQSAWTEDGASCFERHILEVLPLRSSNKQMHARERFWIHRYKERLYNDSRTIADRFGAVDEQTAEGALWPFPVPMLTPRRQHLGPPDGVERRKVMYPGRSDHVRLAEIEAEDESRHDVEDK
jgi:hypothetical protein